MVRVNHLLLMWFLTVFKFHSGFLWFLQEGRKKPNFCSEISIKITKKLPVKVWKKYGVKCKQNSENFADNVLTETHIFIYVYPYFPVHFIFQNI